MTEITSNIKKIIRLNNQDSDSVLQEIKDILFRSCARLVVATAKKYRKYDKVCSCSFHVQLIVICKKPLMLLEPSLVRSASAGPFNTCPSWSNWLPCNVQ